MDKTVCGQIIEKLFYANLDKDCSKWVESGERG